MVGGSIAVGTPTWMGDISAWDTRDVRIVEEGFIWSRGEKLLIRSGSHKYRSFPSPRLHSHLKRVVFSQTATCEQCMEASSGKRWKCYVWAVIISEGMGSVRVSSHLHRNKVQSGSTKSCSVWKRRWVGLSSLPRRNIYFPNNISNGN